MVMRIKDKIHGIRLCLSDGGQCAIRTDLFPDSLSPKLMAHQRELARHAARLDAEQEALNAKYRKESESDFAFMSVFGVVTRGRGVQ